MVPYKALFFCCVLLFCDIHLNSCAQDKSPNIDYDKYFSQRVLRNAYSENTSKEYLRSINAPFLEIGKMVPNGGSLRAFRGTVYDSNREGDLWDVFEESPYLSGPPMYYMRYIWCQLEDNNGHYLFDEVLEPVLKDCIEKKARFTIGLLINAYSIESVFAGYTYDEDGIKRKYSIPTYIFNKLQASQYPMIKDDYYSKWWSPNLDSPYLYERFEAFIKALDTWLEKPVKGTRIKRRDVVFAVEERYLSDWGEGGLWGPTIPKTNMIENYHNVLLTTFYDKIIIAPSGLVSQLPVKKDSYSTKEKTIMRCVYNMLSTGTSKGTTGLFRDSWRAYDNVLDSDFNRMMMDKDGNEIPLYDFIVSNTFPNGYTTGEFGFLQNVDQYGLVPYQTLYYSFSHMKMNGISIHNYTISEKSINKDYPKTFVPYGSLQIARDMLSVTGYRIVMNDSFIVNNSDGTISVRILFSNIGTSKMFADYYRPHLIVRDEYYRITGDYVVDFDLRTVLPSENVELGAYNPSHGYVLSYTLPALKKNIKKAYFYLRIDDVKGIEYPMTLSNYGRLLESSGGDGSYRLGSLRFD